MAITVKESTSTACAPAYLSLLLLGLFCGWSAWAQPPSKPGDASASDSQRDGRHDFDFEVGRWRAHVKTLGHRLSHSNDWDELSGTVVTRTLPMLEGWNESEMQVDSPKSGRHIALLVAGRSSCDANRTKLEQAYSDDGGKTWETNWIYDGERLPE